MSDEQEPTAYPCCERCWIRDNSQWEPDGVSEEGKLITRLVSVAIPISTAPGRAYVCASCGDLTVVGLFREMSEDEVHYDVDPRDILDEG